MRETGRSKFEACPRRSPTTHPCLNYFSPRRSTRKVYTQWCTLNRTRPINGYQCRLPNNRLCNPLNSQSSRSQSVRIGSGPDPLAATKARETRRCLDLSLPKISFSANHKNWMALRATTHSTKRYLRSKDTSRSRLKCI